MLDQNKTSQELLDQNVISNLLVGDQEYDINSKYWGRYEPSDIKTINGESIFEDGGGDIVTSPITFGEAENSAVLAGLDNTVISEGSLALGNGNISGLTGWYYGAIKKNNDTSINVYLSSKQVIPTWGSTSVSNPSNANPYELLGKNTVVSLINDSKYDNKFIISNGRAGMVQLSTADGSKLPFGNIVIEDELALEDYSVYCLTRPTVGEHSLATGAFSEGYLTEALNGSAHAEGYLAKAHGKFSHAEGRNTTALYAAHAEGQDTNALGTRSHAEGFDCTANGNGSHVEGQHNVTNGQASHGEGYYTVTNNVAEHAEGKYNASIKSSDISKATHVSIGIGTSETDRKNAFEVKQNGDIYIKGLGGYEGNNSESSSNLAKVITDLDEVMNQKISKLIDNAPETYDTLKEIADYIASDKDHAKSVLSQLSTLDKKIETKVKTSEIIQVAGGPLANDILDTDYWPNDWYETPGDKTTVRIIPANTSFDDIIRTLFLRELEGTAKWNAPSWSPSVGQPSVNLSSSGSLEAGTKIKITKTTAGTVSSNTRSATCTASYGYFLADVNDNPTGSHNTNTTLTLSEGGESDNKVSYTYTWNGNSVNAGDDMQVKDNSNTLKVSQSGPTVSVDALPTTKVFASTNTKRPMTNVHDTLTDTKPANKTLSNSRDYTVTGVRYAFTGAVASGFVANSANVRKLTQNGYSKSALTKMTASEGNTQIIIAFPKTWGSLSEVKDNNALGAVITDKFKLTDNVKVEGANGFTAIDYKIYVYTSGVVLGAIDYSIIIK